MGLRRPWIWTAGLASVLPIVRRLRLGSLFSSNYLPHRFCYLAQPWLVWTNAVTDSLIAVSYCVIFCCLARLVVGWRRVAELQNYLWVFASFGLFILACGTTHLMEVVTVWTPVYPLSAAFKVVCAVVSVPTAVVFALRTPMISRALAHFLDLISAERLESIEALRTTEALLERTGRLAGVGGWELEIDSRKLTWSAEMFRIFGYSPEHQPSFSESMTFYTPESRELLLSALARAGEEGIGWSLELETRRLNGQPIWVRCVGAVDRSPERTPRIHGALQDITAHVERQQTLCKTEEFLDRTGQLAKVGGWQIDLASMTLTLSEETNRILGLPPGHIPTFDEAIEIYPPESREVVAEAVERGSREGKGWDIEVRVFRRDGEPIWVRVIGAAEMVDDKAVRLTGAIQDITARVERQEALLRANERTALATESGRIGIWDWDVQNQVSEWDAWTFRLYGLEPQAEPVTYDLWSKILHPEDLEAVEAQFARALEDRTLFESEYRVIWPDGSVHHIHGRGRVTLDQSGRPIRMVGANWDVTEQRRLAAESERLVKLELELRDDFLSHVSHELRSPLASIYSFTSIMADGLAGTTTPEQAEYLGIVLKNSAQLQAMIEDLLHVTQSREGILSVVPRCTSASEAVLEAVQTLHWAALAKNIVVSCPDCVGLPPVYADPTRLRQVLIVLLDNAVKFTPEGGVVEVRAVTRPADSLLIEVSDTGCGISRNDLARIFEHLYQIGASDNAGRNGLGLGLHIAQDLVIRQGGKIWASSEVGIGSVFSFTVPTDAGHRLKIDPDKATDDLADRKLIVR